MHIFLLTLPEEVERRRSGIEKLQNAKLRFEIVDGMSGWKWRSELLPVDHSNWGQPLTPGEVGSYHGHLRALRRIVEYDLPWACVLEDDFCFEPTADLRLDDLDAALPAAFHFVHIHHDYGNNHNYRVLQRGKYFHRVCEPPLCAGGYVITQPLARHVLAEHGLCKMPIDHLYALLSHRGLFYHAAKPLVGCQPGLKSVVCEGE